MYNFASKELFINLDKKDIPPKNHPDYLALRDLEKKKCIEGVNINGVHIWGSLYYTTNHHHISIDVDDPFIPFKVKRAELRDNEWIIHEAYNQAMAPPKTGLCIGAARQIGKSEFLVSEASRQLFLFQDSEVVAVFTSDADKQTFTKKLQVAIQNNTDFLVVPNIDKDLTKKYIRFGVTKKNNDPFIYSKLYLFLNSEGANTEVAAGKTISFFVMDEIAKNPMKETYEAVLPALNGKFGLRCSPILIFTGGNVERSKDAEGIFYNPVSNKVKPYTYNGRESGLFIPGEYQMGFKDEVPFTDFYKEYYNLPAAPVGHPELDNLTIWKTDWDRAVKTLDDSEIQAKGESLLTYQKRKMYAPRKVSDIFLKTESNNFAHLAGEFEQLLEYIRANESAQAKSTELIGNETTGVTFKYSDKPLLYDYPISDAEKWRKDSGLAILDPPRLQHGTKLYVIGCDPFNMIKANKEASLGSFYVMRRETTDFGDPYGGRIVAWYNGRKDISHFRKLLLQTIVLYGGMEGCCTLLHEASDDSLTQWFNEKNLGYLLEDTYALSREINPNSQVANVKGMRPTVRNQSYYLGKLLDYCEEELPDGRLGLWRINDPYVIKQLMSFDGDLGVVDAVAGLGHTMVHFFKERRFKAQIYGEVKPKVKKNKSGNAFGFHNNSSNFEGETKAISII